MVHGARALLEQPAGNVFGGRIERGEIRQRIQILVIDPAQNAADTFLEYAKIFEHSHFRQKIAPEKHLYIPIVAVRGRAFARMASYMMGRRKMGFHTDFEHGFPCGQCT